MNKPIIIYVSGAPGSGKSTLAKILSERLHIPLIASDLVHGGARFSGNGDDRGKTIHEVFVPLMTFMAERGESFIVDNVLQQGVSKTDIIDKLSPVANVLYIHTQAEDPIKRYTERIQSSTVQDIAERRDELLARAKHHADNLAKTQTPLDLGLPTLVINTDDDYNPKLESIIEFIYSNRKINV